MKLNEGIELIISYNKDDRKRKKHIKQIIKNYQKVRQLNKRYFEDVVLKNTYPEFYNTYVKPFIKDRGKKDKNGLPKNPYIFLPRS